MDGVPRDGPNLIQALLTLLGCELMDSTMTVMEEAFCVNCKKAHRRVKCCSQFTSKGISEEKLSSSFRNMAPIGKYRCCGKDIPGKDIRCLPVKLPKVWIVMNEGECEEISAVDVSKLYHKSITPERIIVKTYAMCTLLFGNEIVFVYDGKYHHLDSDFRISYKSHLPKSKNGVVLLSEIGYVKPKFFSKHVITGRGNDISTEIENEVDRMKFEVELCLETLLEKSDNEELLEYMFDVLAGKDVSKTAAKCYLRNCCIKVGRTSCCLCFETTQQFIQANFEDISKQASHDIIRGKDDDLIYIIILFSNGLLLVNVVDMEIWIIGDNAFLQEGLLLFLTAIIL